MFTVANAHCIICNILFFSGYPTNIAPATLQWAARGQPPCGSQPTFSHWVAQRSADFMLDWFWSPIANLMPPLCLQQWHRVGFQPSATGWLVEADLLCAEPFHCCQRPTGGPRGVNRRPSCPPLCLLSPPGGRLSSV